MELAQAKKTEQLPYKVKDISLTDWGRKEISLAEAEMPGLMSIRQEYGNKKPLEGDIRPTSLLLRKSYNETK